MDLLSYMNGFIACAERALVEYSYWEGYADEILDKMRRAKEAVLMEKNEDYDFLWLCPSERGDVDLRYKKKYFQRVYEIVGSYDAFDKEWAFKIAEYTKTHW